MLCIALHGVGRALKRIELLQPGAFVGGKHAVRLALLGQHLVFFQQHLVFVIAEGDACRVQCLGGLLVPGDGGRLIVAVGQHFLHAQLLRQLHDARHGRAVAHDQPAAGHAMLPGQLLQALVQLQHAGVDELNPPVAARGQGIQDVGIKDKCAIHPGKTAQCVVEGAMVIAAQIAAQPDKRGRRGGWHTKRAVCGGVF